MRIWLLEGERKVLPVQGSRSKATEDSMARKWDQSILDTSHPYELIGAQFQTLFMLFKEEIRHNHVGSCWLTASSGLLSHSSCCLLNAHVTPLCNSRSNPGKALCESRFHSIINRDSGQSLCTHLHAVQHRPFCGLQLQSGAACVCNKPFISCHNDRKTALQVAYDKVYSNSEHPLVKKLAALKQRY